MSICEAPDPFREPSFEELSRGVTEEQFQNRQREILEQARQHDGQPVLVLDVEEHRQLRMGIVSAEALPKDDEDAVPFGYQLTAPMSVSLAGHTMELMTFDFPIRIDSRDIYGTFKETPLTLDIQRFKLIFGNEEIAKFCSDSRNKSPALASSYWRAAKILGVEPAADLPELQRAIAQRKLDVAAQLLRFTLTRENLGEDIERIYESIGQEGSIQEGAGITLTPESQGEANLRTWPLRQNQERVNRVISEFKRELVELGADPAGYGQNILRLLGLELEESPTQTLVN